MRVALLPGCTPLLRGAASTSAAFGACLRDLFCTSAAFAVQLGSSDRLEGEGQGRVALGSFSFPWYFYEIKTIALIHGVGVRVGAYMMGSMVRSRRVVGATVYLFFFGGF